MQAQNNLAKTQSQQATTFERLSTGLRVNSAKDDAGGLYLAQAQTSDIRGLGMATRNAGDGISLAQTAEGALDQIGQNLQRINELAIQSANGTYSDEARAGLQKEVDELTQEISRIYETTEFNGQKLLNNDAAAETLQVGFENNAGSRITTGLEGGLRNVAGVTNSVSISGSSKSFTGVSLVNGNSVGNDAVTGEFRKVHNLGGADATPAIGADNAKKIASALKEIQGEAATLGAGIAAGYTGTATNEQISFNVDGMKMTLQFDVTTGGGNVSSARLFGEADGTTFQVAISTSGSEANGGLTADLAGDYRTDAFTAGLGSLAVQNNVAGPNSETGVWTAEAAGDPLNTIKAFNSNALDGITEGGLTAVKTIDISSQTAAREAITQTRNAIDAVSEIRATFGANMNRFEAVISGNQTYSENLSAARSRIEDADFAVETANLAKQQVLQQAGISALGQANASSQAILGLL